LIELYQRPDPAGGGGGGALGREGRNRRRDDPEREHPANKLQKRIWQPWKQELERRFRERYSRERFTVQRLDSARGRVAAGYLTCLPRSTGTTLTDAEFCLVTRLRLGVPVSTDLPDACVCGEPLSDCYTHLLACKRLCQLQPPQHEGGLPGVRNAWDVRHRLVLEQISADLMTAGVGVHIEPGALDPRPLRHLGDGLPQPDQLITFVAARANGILKRVATDISVKEAVTRATVNAGRSVSACLEERVREKNAIHLEAARAAGCEFVPLVFTSLGRMHEITEKWLKLDDMALDERLLQRIGSGRREFTARLIDGVSCALARGNARILYFVCAEIARARMRAQAPPDQDGRGDWEGLAP
jgi:hypothetical protein